MARTKFAPSMLLIVLVLRLIASLTGDDSSGPTIPRIDPAWHSLPTYTFPTYTVPSTGVDFPTFAPWSPLPELQDVP
ncbi:MAG: hypothetical protein ABIR11_07265 [Candidatus Limnocylindrales bacterium]